MAYIDRVDWHNGGDYPKGLPQENGGTHIGMFLAWAINRGLGGERFKTESKASLKALRERKMTGREFLETECDEKFSDDDLNKEGNTFAKDYYESHLYFSDYEETLGQDLPSLYHVSDTWENYDKIATVIDRRFRDWEGKAPKRKWKFWR